MRSESGISVESDENAIRRLKVNALGPRDYPKVVTTVPGHLVGNLPDLIRRARATNPGLPLDAIIATIWRLGCYRLGQNLLRGIPVRVRDPQGPQSR
jgi:hypothetical protein